MSSDEHKHDVLGLQAARIRQVVQIGSVNVTPGLARGMINSAVNQASTARYDLDLGSLATQPDFFAPVTIFTEARGDRFPRFAGIVQEVSINPEKISTIASHGAMSLLETPVGDGKYRIPDRELIYVLAATGGFRDDQLDIEGLDKLPAEIFEVVVPLEGLALETAAKIGDVHILPRDERILSLLLPELSDSVKQDFEASSYAMVFATERLTLTAERKGLEVIDFALSWLTSLLRFGYSQLPDGTPLTFTRDESLAHIKRRDLVAVRGLSTGRRWIRRPARLSKARTASLQSGDPRFSVAVPPNMEMQDKLSFLALKRAAVESDPMARVFALFEAIEFYVRDVSVPPLFSKSERKAIRRSLPKTPRKDQKRRLDGILQDLNNPPLRIKLEFAIHRDRVPVTLEEIELLWKLRGIRNRVVHGHSIEIPNDEDLDYAVSIVSRILLFRASRLS